MADDPKIRHVTWRDGRPRFSPSPSLRAAGYEGKDLKRPDGRWMTAGEAMDWSRELQRQLAQDKRLARPTGAGRAAEGRAAEKKAAAIPPLFSVETLFDEWLNVKTNPAIADLAEKTVRDYRKKSRVIQERLPDVWESEAAALTKPLCIGLYDTLRRAAGLHTAAGTMRVLGIALQWAMDRGRLPGMLVNPAHKLKMKTPPPRVRFATKEEIRVLVETADAIGAPEIGDMVTLAVWSGQRQADRIAFTAAGRENGRIVFRQEKTRAIVSIREAPELSKRLAAAHKRRQKAEVISPCVILDERAWRRFDEHSYRKRYGEIRLAASKKLKSIATLRDQDFRDTAVTWLAMAGCTIPEICSITGHSFRTAHEVLRHYLALNPKLSDSAISKLIEWHEKDDPVHDRIIQ